MKRFFSWLGVFFILSLGIFMLPSAGYAVPVITVENAGMEVYAGKEAKNPLKIRITDDIGYPLAGYTITAVCGNDKMAKIKEAQSTSDVEGNCYFHLKGGEEMGKLPVFLDVFAPDGSFIVQKKTNVVVLNVKNIIFTVLGGLALFLFGIHLMSDGLQTVAGQRMKTILGLLTKNRFVGVMVGLFVTAIIQSSSATTVMVVGFINAGLMNLYQSIGIIMGANIGTTVTAQLIAFKLSWVALPALTIGFAFFMFSRNDRVKFWGQVVLGFGLLFFGMKLMTDILKPLSASQGISNFFVTFSRSPMLGLLAGTLITMLVQSSSATVGLTIALTSSGLIDIMAMFPIILGDNIGTTITAQLAALSSNRISKQAAMVHTLFNVLGSTFMLLFITFFKDKQGVPWYYRILEAITTGQLFLDDQGRLWLANGNIERYVANAHMMFNVSATLIMFPMGKWLAKLAELIIPAGKSTTLEYLDPHLLEQAPIALEQTKKEIRRMLTLSHEMLGYSIQYVCDRKKDFSAEINEREDLLDKIEYEITHYLIELTKRPILEEEANQVPNLIHSANNIETIGDLCESIKRVTQKMEKENLKFSKDEVENILKMSDEVDKMVSELNEEIPFSRKERLLEILTREQKVNKTHKKLKKRYVHRIASIKETSKVTVGMLFVEVVNALERIGDLLTDICQSLIELKEKPED